MVSALQSGLDIIYAVVACCRFGRFLRLRKARCALMRISISPREDFKFGTGRVCLRGAGINSELLFRFFFCGRGLVKGLLRIRKLSPLPLISRP